MAKISDSSLQFFLWKLCYLLFVPYIGTHFKENKKLVYQSTSAFFYSKFYTASFEEIPNANFLFYTAIFCFCLRPISSSLAVNTAIWRWLLGPLDFSMVKCRGMVQLLLWDDQLYMYRTRDTIKLLWMHYKNGSIYP